MQNDTMDHIHYQRKRKNGHTMSSSSGQENIGKDEREGKTKRKVMHRMEAMVLFCTHREETVGHKMLTNY